MKNMNNAMILLDLTDRRKVTICNHNFSREGILHPNRILDEYDLLLMQNGEWDIIEDNITYHLVPGSVLLLEPGKHHYSITKCSPMMRNIYIHFEYKTTDITCLFENSLPETNCNYLSVPKFCQTTKHSDIQHCFEKVIDSFLAKDSADKNLRLSLSLETLLLKLSDFSQAVYVTKTDILISEIVHRFHCELDIFISPEELAKNYNVSVRTISGRFKKNTGMSIHQYQLQLKLNMAYDILPHSPGRSLRDIALSLGFYDEFQFSKLFKRQFGISPSERR